MAKQPGNDTPHQPTHAKILAAEDPKQPAPSRNTGHPLLRGESQALDYFAKLRENKEQLAMKAEELKEWKATLNRMASTKDGAQVLRIMIMLSGWQQPGNIKDTVRMVEDNGRIDFYLRWIRPYLDATLRKEIE